MPKKSPRPFYVEWHPSYAHHISNIAKDLSEADLTELKGAVPNYENSEQALLASLRRSHRAYIVFNCDRYPVAVFGIASDFNGGGIPWFLGNPPKGYEAYFAKVSKFIIDDLCAGYNWCYNFVWVNNAKAIRWLEWLGFDVDTSREWILNETEIKFYKFTR